MPARAVGTTSCTGCVIPKFFHAYFTVRLTHMSDEKYFPEEYDCECYYWIDYKLRTLTTNYEYDGFEHTANFEDLGVPYAIWLERRDLELGGEEHGKKVHEWERLRVCEGYRRKGRLNGEMKEKYAADCPI